MCAYICILICRYVYVSADRSSDHSVSVTDWRPVPMRASSLFNTGQLKKEGSNVERWWTFVQQSCLSCSERRYRAAEQDGHSLTPIQMSVTACGDYGILKWLQMVWGAHSMPDSSYIQQRPGSVSHHLGRLQFRVSPTTSVTGTFRLSYSCLHFIHEKRR